jgi:hydrogenase maturation protease
VCYTFSEVESGPYVHGLVIGVGNLFRGDDAFGCLVARDLQGKLPGHYGALEHDGEPAGLIECWQGVDSVYLVDAVSSGNKAGTIFDFDLAIRSLPEEFNLYSTHAFGVPQAVELARAINRLPKAIRFVGVEGESFDAGTGLSSAVDAARRLVAVMILNKIERENNNA